MTLNQTTLIDVMNLADHSVGYELPELHVSRNFLKGETKKVSVKELRALQYLPGGDVLIRDYLSVKNQEFLDEIGLEPEEEYNWTEADVKDLLENQPLDKLKDALDFAPAGIIDMIKSLAVTLKLNDMNKRTAIQEATGLNITNAIALNETTPEEEAAEAAAKEAKPSRRVISRETTDTK